MLRLVRVNRKDVDVLFQLVCLNEPRFKQDLMAGLMEMSKYFDTSGDKNARLVLPPDLFTELMALVQYPWMPADAEKWGMPMDIYLDIVARIPSIQEAFSLPEMVDFNFLNVRLPQASAGLPN